MDMREVEDRDDARHGAADVQDFVERAEQRLLAGDLERQLHFDFRLVERVEDVVERIHDPFVRLRRPVLVVEAAVDRQRLGAHRLGQLARLDDLLVGVLPVLLVACQVRVVGRVDVDVDHRLAGHAADLERFLLLHADAAYELDLHGVQLQVAGVDDAVLDGPSFAREGDAGGPDPNHKISVSVWPRCRPRTRRGAAQ